jgi:hypothetical protein
MLREYGHPAFERASSDPIIIPVHPDPMAVIEKVALQCDPDYAPLQIIEMIFVISPVSVRIYLILGLVLVLS